MVDEPPNNPIDHEAPQGPAPAKNGDRGAGDHRYEVGPGFEIAVRGEAKHPVEVNLTKDSDHERRHGHLERRVEELEQTVRELAARLARAEAASEPAPKTA